MHKKFYFVFLSSLVLLLAHSSFSEHQALEDQKKAETKFELSSNDGNYKMRLFGLLQNNNEFSHTKVGSQNEFRTEIKTAHFGIRGNAFSPDLTYLFKAQFENDGGGNYTIRDENSPALNRYPIPGSYRLRDYYLNYSFIDEYLQLRIGKFRAPFSRQGLLDSSVLQFYDLPLANRDFMPTQTGRDVGIMLHSGLGHPFEYALALVSNGLFARFGYNYGGIDSYNPVDFTGGDLRFAVALSGFMETQYQHSKLNKDIRLSADYIIKLMHFSTNGEFFYRHIKDKNQFGGSVDLAYLIAQKIEPALRGSLAKQGDKLGAEILGEVNYYVFANNLKAQLYGGIELSDKDINQGILGLQFQLAI
jgi:hypothetical protein